MKIHPVGGELFSADRETDTTEPILCFSQFGERT